MKKRSNKQELAALKAASIKKEKHDATMAVLYILAGLLCTVLVVTGGVLGFRAIRKSYLDSGRKYRNTLVYQTDHFEVNMAMFSYRFYSDLYSGRLDALGLDRPLKKESSKIITNTPPGSLPTASGTICLLQSPPP